MASYFNINEGFSRHLEKMKEAQKAAATINPDLINYTTLLCMGIEVIHECGLFERTLDEWEELAAKYQTWAEFQSHFQDSGEKFNINKRIHD